MTKTMRGIAAFGLLAVLSTGSRAQDDFMAVCTAAEKSELQVKVCTCMSPKLTADGPAVIAMMRKVNEVTAKGQEPDIAKMSPEEVALLGKIMETLASCFQ